MQKSSRLYVSITSSCKNSYQKKEERFVEQTGRLRQVQDELFTLKENYSDLKLELALKRCERKKCGEREPQNGY